MKFKISRCFDYTIVRSGFTSLPSSIKLVLVQCLVAQIYKLGLKFVCFLLQFSSSFPSQVTSEFGKNLFGCFRYYQNARSRQTCKIKRKSTANPLSAELKSRGSLLRFQLLQSLSFVMFLSKMVHLCSGPRKIKSRSFAILPKKVHLDFQNRLSFVHNLT